MTTHLRMHTNSLPSKFKNVLMSLTFRFHHVYPVDFLHILLLNILVSHCVYALHICQDFLHLNLRPDSDNWFPAVTMRGPPKVKSYEAD